ncbi:MAG: DUF2092 domain-containing protein [Candidatus Latescibacteria bacterium]|nr:DUF2092 domain-containing protein [Candidatus Latescibacterota bacterium]
MVIKTWCGALLFLLAAVSAFAAEPVNDAVAVQLLDRMSAVIGELGSCSFTLASSNDVIDQDHGLVTRCGLHEVHMVGPDRMLVNSRLDDLHHGYWYNGKTITYYSYDENNYAIVKAPDSILGTIDAINRDYGVDFPAADFFFPNFTDDLIDGSDEIRYLGKRIVDGQPCFHILAASRETRIQFWIADDALNLPVRYSIMRTGKSGTTQFTGTFSNWLLNPELPTAMFDFSPPLSATEITLMPKKGR